MTRLSVNLNRVALLRNSRPLDFPDLAHMAKIAIDAGAHGITVHPRPDARHIRPADVHGLSAFLQQRPAAEFNIEGNPFHQLLDFVLAVRPAQTTFVPDAMGAATSDHGWDLRKDGSRLEPLIEKCKAAGVRVSLFMDPVAGDMKLAKALGADRVELYTEPYAKYYGEPDGEKQIQRYADTATEAQNLGLGVNAGHDLNLRNLTRFVRSVPNVLEVSIGHALICDAIEFGLAETVRRYLECLRAGSAK